MLPRKIFWGAFFIGYYFIYSEGTFVHEIMGYHALSNNLICWYPCSEIDFLEIN